MAKINLQDKMPRLGVSGLVVTGQEVLLVKRKKQPAKGLWSLPGGSLEFGETLKEAACREVLEETGLHINSLEFIELVEVTSPDFHFVIAVHAARLDKKVEPKAGDDAEEAIWYDISMLGTLDEQALITPGTAKRIKRLSKEF